MGKRGCEHSAARMTSQHDRPAPADGPGGVENACPELGAHPFGRCGAPRQLDDGRRDSGICDAAYQRHIRIRIDETAWEKEECGAVRSQVGWQKGAPEGRRL